MPVTSVTSDPAALTITVVAESTHPVRRLWDAYADPRQLERFWGPVEWPATFTRHHLATGGESHYAMTGPAGETSAGYWKYLAVDEGRSFEVEDGFAGEPGVPNPALPSMRMVFTFEPTAAGSRVTTVTHFGSTAELEQLLTMGMDEGMRSALSQLDAVLDDLTTFAVGAGTTTQIIDDTRVRVSRIIRGSIEQVWRAHHDPAQLQRWLLGPDGWTMPVCEVAAAVGDSYTYEWRQSDGDARFGFTGELLASHPPVREVTTERVLGTDGPSTVNELTLTSVEDGTLLSLLITYPSAELRDQVLGTGMTDGMEASYARLEREVLAPH